MRNVRQSAQVEGALIRPHYIVNEAIAVLAHPAAPPLRTVPAAATRPRAVAPVPAPQLLSHAQCHAPRSTASCGGAHRLPGCHEHAMSWLSMSLYAALHRQQTRLSSPGSTAIFFVCWCCCMSSSRVRRSTPPAWLSPASASFDMKGGGGMGGSTAL